MQGPLEQLGRVFLGLGAAVAGVGILLIIAGKIPYLGRLPGDIDIHKGNFRLYFPLATSLALSLILSIVFSLFRRR